MVDAIVLRPPSRFLSGIVYSAITANELLYPNGPEYKNLTWV